MPGIETLYGVPDSNKSLDVNSLETSRFYSGMVSLDKGGVGSCYLDYFYLFILRLFFNQDFRSLKDSSQYLLATCIHISFPCSYYTIY